MQKKHTIGKMSAACLGHLFKGNLLIVLHYSVTCNNITKSRKNTLSTTGRYSRSVPS
jgi:hypothetical protein